MPDTTNLGQLGIVTLAQEDTLTDARDRILSGINASQQLCTKEITDYFKKENQNIINLKSLSTDNSYYSLSTDPVVEAPSGYFSVSSLQNTSGKLYGLKIGVSQYRNDRLCTASYFGYRILVDGNIVLSTLYDNVRPNSANSSIDYELISLNLQDTNDRIGDRYFYVGDYIPFSNSVELQYTIGTLSQIEGWYTGLCFISSLIYALDS